MKVPLLFFDAHNHIHLGSASPFVAAAAPELCGFALMSTQPVDFPVVSQTIREITKNRPEGGAVFVPCFGTHPWFLNQVLGKDDENKIAWLESSLRDTLEQHPSAAVGEIGLDGHRFDDPQNPRRLSSSMEDQIRVFEAQMKIAWQYQRPASVHAVKCWGPLMTVLAKLKKQKQLPPKIYFHAFGAKPGFLDQLLALLDKEEATELFFGFAPIINMRSQKTCEVIQKVGIHRIVLESDLEDASGVAQDIRRCAEFVSQCLDIPLQEVANRTWENSKRLYGLSSIL